jgi:hypothetical protein
MNKKRISLNNSLVKKDDRTSDGNLLPETRERILKSIKEHLEYAGRANISEIARMVGLSRQTTKNLINEILAEWHQDIQDQTLVQARWVEFILKDIDENPETFDKDKIAVVNLKSSLLNKLNALQKLALKENSTTVSLYLIKKEAPKELPDSKPP